MQLKHAGEELILHVLYCYNSLAPHVAVILRILISNSLYRILAWSFAAKMALRWMNQNLTNKKSTLVQVMAWCHQAASHYWAKVDPDLCCHLVSLGHNELNCHLFLDFVFPHTESLQVIENPSLWKTMTYLSYTINIKAADGLTTKGARASAAMILT